MRLYFDLSPNLEPVPFDYQHALTQTFHRWLGHNRLHDEMSLYSLSWLSGGRADGSGLNFVNGARWFISAHDDALIAQIANAALRDSSVCFGMRVEKMIEQNTPRFGSYSGFKVGSPVLARAKEVEGKVRHLLWSEAEADEVLTATLRHKMDKAGLPKEHHKAVVRFDRAYAGAKTKLVTIKGIGNRASLCPVIVEGTPEAVQFAWNVGVGHSTGNGFGCLL